MYILQKWVSGDFVADWASRTEPPRSLDEVSLDQQPLTLDKAALHFCLADAFHPGCEMTWPVRHATMYSAPFRIRHRPEGEPEPDYGPVLLPEVAVGMTGPLHAQGPGDISRWMAIPWQADTASCRSAYTDPGMGQYDPYVPTFWPARVPNHVLTEDNYNIVMDQSKSRQERIAAFRERASWFRVLEGSSLEQKDQMVRDFYKMGVVEVREGIPDDPDFPPYIFVESRPEFAVDEISPRRNLVMMHMPQAMGGAAPAAGAQEAALRSAARPTGEVVTGYHDEAHRFVRRPYVLVPSSPDTPPER
jgi:hypothetical protein